MVVVLLLFGVLLKGKFMDIVQDYKREDVIIVSFDFDQMSAIKREALYSQKLLIDVMREVICCGIRKLHRIDRAERKAHNR